MNMLIKRRQLVMATMVIALGAAVFVNWYFTKPHIKDTKQSNATVQASEADVVNLGDAEFVNGTTSKDSKNKKKDTKKKTSDEYFAEAKLNRDKAHDKAMNNLNKIISNKNSSKSAIDKASDDLTILTNTIKQEADTENLIKAKVKSKCIVAINAEKVEVVVEKKVLNANMIMQIKDIIMKQCKASPDNITIVEVK